MAQEGASSSEPILAPVSAATGIQETQQDASAPSLASGPSRKGKEKVKDTDITPECAGTKDENVLKYKIRKLAPQRPFPTVPASVSATGPRSAHTEGKNYICVTRQTPLGAYLRRCKDVIMKDGYKNLHLSAMGAAIPHLTLITLSIPSILPYSADELRTEIRTSTVEVQDEIIPEDEDEDISYRSRGKSTLSVTITIGDGVDELQMGKNKSKGKRGGTSTVAAAGGNTSRVGGKTRPKPGAKGPAQVRPAPIVVREDELDTA